MGIEQLKEEYSKYENSGYFIECVYEAFKSNKQIQIKWFIKNHFLHYQHCDYGVMRKCSTHWNNIAIDKLNNFDFKNYIYGLLTSANYKMVAKVMSQYNEINK